MAGGTGGHVFPGLAVAQWLQARGWRVVWLGNPTGMEATLIPQYQIPMEFVRFGGLRGKGLRAKLMLPINLLRACWQSACVLRRVKPDVVLGMGGYITFPAGLVLHEQNSIAGLANRVLSRIARRTLVAFPDALPNAEWTGNPIRASLTELPPPAVRYAERSGPLRVLVVGGSLGAAALNEVVPAALACLPQAVRPCVVHQAGAKHLAALQENYLAAGLLGSDASTITLLPFIDDMALAYSNADLVICRAGAMTISEIAAVGVAALFVPFPHAVDDHQTANAAFLTKHDAALAIQQRDLSVEKLADWLGIQTRASLCDLAIRAYALAKPAATQRVAEVCAELGATGAKRQTEKGQS